MTMGESGVAKALRETLREGFQPRFGELGEAFPAHELWASLRAQGTRIWLDTGDLEGARSLWTREMEALTTNNTLLNAEIQKGIYDDDMKRFADVIRQADTGIASEELVREIAFALNARHGLKLVETFDAYVSVELDTAVSHDFDRTVSYGRRFHAICPERFYVKVPLTPTGILAARQLGQDGIPINFTLGFSARQNLLISHLARTTYCNVFLGRLNAYVAGEKIGDGTFVGERVALASQAMLAKARSQGVDTLQIGASLRDAGQVESLAGLDVLTIPVKVAKGFVDSGTAPASLGNRMSSDYVPPLADGIDARAEGLEALWTIDPKLERAVDALDDAQLTSMDGKALQDYLHECGVGDVFPRFSADDLATLDADGKIPKRATWKTRVASGEVGLDALFTQAGLLSFTQDQAALDGRIRKTLAL